MTVCPHRYSEAGGTGASYEKLDILVTRDDIPEHPEIALEAGGGGNPWHLHLSVDHSYIYSFRNHSLPDAFTFLMLGLDSGHSQQVGFCPPLVVPEEEIVFNGKPARVEVESNTWRWWRTAPEPPSTGTGSTCVSSRHSQKFELEGLQ